MVVLDSDILVDLLRGNRDTYNIVEKLENKNEGINTTVINAFELLEGAAISGSKEKEKQAENLLRSFGLYDFNSPASWKAAEISATLKKKGETIDFQDIAIAAISIINDELLVTRNTKHFERIRELKIEKW